MRAGGRGGGRAGGGDARVVGGDGAQASTCAPSDAAVPGDASRVPGRQEWRGRFAVGAAAAWRQSCRRARRARRAGGGDARGGGDGVEASTCAPSDAAVPGDAKWVSSLFDRGKGAQHGGGARGRHAQRGDGAGMRACKLQPRGRVWATVVSTSTPSYRFRGLRMRAFMPTPWTGWRTGLSPWPAKRNISHNPPSPPPTPTRTPPVDTTTKHKQKIHAFPVNLCIGPVGPAGPAGPAGPPLCQQLGKTKLP